MRMFGFFSTEIEDFPITIYGCLFIFPAVLAQMTLHEPGLGVPRIYCQDAIEKDLGNIPPFFGDCSRSMRAINANMRLAASLPRQRISAKNSDSFHHLQSQSVALQMSCQDDYQNLMLFFRRKT